MADRRCSSLGSEGTNIWKRKSLRRRIWSPVLSVGWSVGQLVGGVGWPVGAHVSQPIRSVLSRDRDFVLCGEAGLGGLLKVELLEAVE